MLTRIAVLIVAAAALVTLTVAAPASAKDPEVRVRGTCTKASTSKLKLSKEDGRIEVELEVDQNVVGVRWTVTLTRAGRTLWRGVRTTRAPSGSFEARRLVADTAGPDRIVARATRTGEACRASATL